ncbi:MAG TPA: CPBP family glutamic-type intramembrane protease [bacterium]|nr:CPBP family glutamic-type intramembrane protease [bacterium]
MAKRKSNRLNQALKDYAAYTRSPLQSVIFVLPVFLLYEGGLFLFNRSDVTGIRNGADVLLRQFYGLFGLYGFYAFAVSLLGILLFTFWLEYQREEKISLQPNYFLGMLGESVIYGVILFIFLSKIAAIDLQVAPVLELQTIQQLVLAMGAGIYEELVFRVLIVSGIATLMIVVARWKIHGAYGLGILLSALVFSWFHYVGIYGDSFQVRTFLLRTIAGIVLSVLYVFRGFGITAYTHIFYDFIIILFVSNQ